MGRFYPMTVEQLTEAWTIPDDSDDELFSDELPDAIDNVYVQDLIIDLGGFLVEVRATESSEVSALISATVHLVHFSVKECLISRLPRSEDFRPPFMKQISSAEFMHINHLILLSHRNLSHNSEITAAAINLLDHLNPFWHWLQYRIEDHHPYIIMPYVFYDFKPPEWISFQDIVRGNLSGFAAWVGLGC
ncbi:hypothetical protein PspLS_11497 [Pyricularia sp. CBS 133598]|nr:hypothetical protein PspLS_11497 [Pyricularia sp. CBS 133598]